MDPALVLRGVGKDEAIGVIFNTVLGKIAEFACWYEIGITMDSLRVVGVLAARE